MITYLKLEKEEKKDMVSYYPVFLFFSIFLMTILFFFFFPITEEVKYQGIYLEGGIQSIVPLTFLVELNDYTGMKVSGKTYQIQEVEVGKIIPLEKVYSREVVFKIGEVPLQEGDVISFFLTKRQTTILEKIMYFMKGESS